MGAGELREWAFRIGLGCAVAAETSGGLAETKGATDQDAHQDAVTIVGGGQLNRYFTLSSVSYRNDLNAGGHPAVSYFVDDGFLQRLLSAEDGSAANHESFGFS